MFKTIVVDRNGRVSKYVTNERPKVNGDALVIYNTEFHTLVFIIPNLVSYSITDLRRNKDENNEKEQVHV